MGNSLLAVRGINHKYIVVDMEEVSERLAELINLVNTIYLGFEKEKLEKQVLDCIMCICHGLKGIHMLTKRKIDKGADNRKME